jgi:hypothetical protein
MATTTKTERIAQSVIDLLDYKYGSGASSKKYDTNSDVYISLAVGGTVKALVKFEPVAVEANNAVNPITGNAGSRFVPDLCRVGFDLGKKASGNFTMAAAPSAPTGVVAKNSVAGLGILDTNTVVVNGVTFTAVGAAPGVDEFLSGPGAGSDAASMADLARAINASSTAGVAGIYAVQRIAAPTNVDLYAKYSGTGPNAWTLADGGSTNFTPGGATFANGTAGSTAVINGVTFQTVKAADYAIVIGAPVPGSGPGTLFFSEGTTDVSAAISLAAAINACVTVGIAGVVTAAVDSLAPTHVVVTAVVPGLAGNAITTTRTGTSVPAVSGVALTGGLATTVDEATQAYVASTVALTGVEVNFYSKTGIVIGDLVAATVPYQTFRNEWGYLNQQ